MAIAATVMMMMTMMMMMIIVCAQSELEAAYINNAERLDRLGVAQADMLALLTAKVSPQPPHTRPVLR